MPCNRFPPSSRRRFLASVSALPILAFAGSAVARSISGALPWHPLAGEPPVPVDPRGWHVFTHAEAAAVEAIVDRLIPPDELSAGGREAGCAVFIDRQLAGSFGTAARLYTKGPFRQGLPTQGYQGAASPVQRYRDGLRALDAHAMAAHGRPFAQLAPQDQDAMLEGMESGRIDLNLAGGLSTKSFFELLLQNTVEGFFADPLYGGNRNMAGWKLLGFPGARYDYRDHAGRHNVPYPLGPVSIFGEG